MYSPPAALLNSNSAQDSDARPIEKPRSASAKRAKVSTVRGWANRLWLVALVHGDAFRFDPIGYVQALMWRIRGLKLRSRNRFAALMGRSPRAYRLWIARTEPTVRAELLANQTSSSREVIAVVDCTGAVGSLERTLESLAAADGAAAPVVVGHQGAPGTIAVRTPAELAAIVSPTGTWLCIVRAGDQLAPGAIRLYATAAADAHGASVVYADDDLQSHRGRRSPHFKCAWNPELFDHHDFVTAAAILRVSPEMLAGLDGNDWVAELTHRAIGRGSPPAHLPAVLHHRLHRPEPVLPVKPMAALAEPGPAVTIIIPTRNRASYLRKCIEGVRGTAYANLELTVVNNASDEPDTLDYLAGLRREGVHILDVGGTFNFSALNNAAVQHARGELLCFLNNDVEMIDPDWLSLMVQHARRPGVGAVGCRLVYPDGAVQHAGVVTGIGGGAAHAHRNLRDDDPGYFYRDRLPQRVSAVTAACLVVARNKFEAVGGFNEVDFPVAFNDVDLCLKLNARGWHSFYEPRAVLIHHESKSRGSDSAKGNRMRFAAELAALKRHWGTDRLRDPYHHPHLSPFCEQFHVAV